MRFRHYKGGYYRLLHNPAIFEATLAPMVVYQSEEDGTVWVRPVENFFGMVRDKDKTVRRFVPASEYEQGKQAGAKPKGP